MNLYVCVCVYVCIFDYKRTLTNLSLEFDNIMLDLDEVNVMIFNEMTDVHYDEITNCISQKKDKFRNSLKAEINRWKVKEFSNRKSFQDDKGDPGKSSDIALIGKVTETTVDKITTNILEVLNSG